MRSHSEDNEFKPESANKRGRLILIAIWGLVFIFAAAAIYDRSKKQVNLEAAKFLTKKLETIHIATGIKVEATGFQPGFRNIELDTLEITLPRKSIKAPLTEKRLNKTLELLRQVEPSLKSLALFLLRPANDTHVSKPPYFTLSSLMPSRMVFDIRRIAIHVAENSHPNTQETLLAAEHFHFRIHPKRRRINFYASDIKMAGLPREKMVGGHVKLHRSSGDVEVLAFKSPDSRSHSWGMQINGNPDAQRIKMRVFGTHMPGIIATILNSNREEVPGMDLAWLNFQVKPSNDTTFETTVEIEPLGKEMVAFELSLNFRDLFIQHGKLASDEIGPLHMDSSISGTLDPATLEVIIDHGRIELPTPLEFEAPERAMAQRSRFDFNVTGGLEPAIILNFRGNGPVELPTAAVKFLKSRLPPRSVRTPPDKWQIEAFIARTPCQAFLDIIPPRMAPAIKSFLLQGEFMGVLKIDWPTNDPAKFKYKLSHNEFDCAVESAPDHFNVKRLRSPLTISRSSRGMTRREIQLSDKNPNFTDITKISPNFLKSVIAAEDAGFWNHRGLDLYSFVEALRDNLSGGRKLRGGSTITMQTIKNIFLTSERTVSRKIQEYFLSWYIGAQISRERILEIYANAVEFGPDIFGVGEASHLYFNKKAEQLTLKESLFLANLLPAPVSRAAAFCRKHTPTPNQRSLMNQLLSRMRRLKIITPQQATLTEKQNLKFNSNTEAMHRICHPTKEST